MKPIPVPEKLTIITPHNTKIRNAFKIGFEDWYQETEGKYIQVEWIVRGTPRCVEYINDTFMDTGNISGFGTPEIMFGGGVADHMLLVERGQTQKLDLKDVLKDVPEQVNGLPTRDVDGNWFATGLSSFGLVYNDFACKQRGIQVPTTWSDLADPRYFGWLGLADPAYSGSNRQSMLFMLQSEGWNSGWQNLIRILGNSRATLDSSTVALDQIVNGVFLAGFAVNFDGLARANESNGKVAYLNPSGVTAATPDVTSVLRSAHDVKLAEDFVRFCLSDAGQAIWSKKGELKEDGSDSLYHYPIRPDVYEKLAGQLSVDENPFQTDFGLQVDLARAESQLMALNFFVRAATGKNHILLQQAWKSVIDSGMKPELVNELCRPPVNEEEAVGIGKAYLHADKETAKGFDDKWAGVFRDKYESVIKKCQG